ncbi:hypothetical protein DEO72_LG7g811 [Vigna unguiculata]|uniref:Uncharacterized protein n=1 Tax=Vigna unguiculata TaxID=3917 RepID=A0A4D6MGZ3_VIGUN|nr:hypothetical protein DEO72_LG7g811 [Vigna unguiculata]
MNKINPAPKAKQRNHHFLADHENLAHLLPSIKLMIIARKKNHIQDNHKQTSYIDGAPPWTPTTRGHGITSRPLKRDPESLTYRPKELCTDTDKVRSCSQIIFTMQGYIHYVNL